MLAKTPSSPAPQTERRLSLGEINEVEAALEIGLKPSKKVIEPDSPEWQASERRYFRARQRANCAGWLELYELLESRHLSLAAVNADKAREARQQLRRLEDAG